jgi:hypothetical protein
VGTTGFVARIPAAMHSHPLQSWAGIVAYALAVSLPHANVQWEVNELAIRITLTNLYLLSAVIALALGAMVTLALLRHARQPQRGMVAGLWVLTVALIFGIWRGLTANNVELVHYPQYFPEGVAFAALTLSPLETLSWIVIFGGLDESYQYWVLSRGRPTLLDFNDIYMDLLGGAAGMVFAMAFLGCARRPGGRRWLRDWKRPGALLLLAVTAAGSLLWASGRMLAVEDATNHRYWFALGRFQAPSFWAQIEANGPLKYHTFTPIEGIGMIFFTIMLYAALSRNYAFGAEKGSARVRQSEAGR